MQFFLGNTDAETDSGAEGERSSSLFSAIEADSISIPSNRQLSSSELAVRKGQVRSSVERAIDMMEMFVSSEDEVDADKTICAMETGKIINNNYSLFCLLKNHYKVQRKLKY